MSDYVAQAVESLNHYADLIESGTTSEGKDPAELRELADELRLHMPKSQAQMVESLLDELEADMDIGELEVDAMLDIMGVLGYELTEGSAASHAFQERRVEDAQQMVDRQGD